MGAPEQVSAIIVTRGDVPLDEITHVLSSVPRIDDIVIWDNSKEDRDYRVWGRHAALNLARHSVIYSQDDDLVHTVEGVNRILDAYEPGLLTGCMWPEWSAGAEAQNIPGGYSDLAFPGSGSVYAWETPLLAAERYLNVYPSDDFFLTWCDAIIGVLAPTKQLDERFAVLPASGLPDRLARIDRGGVLKREAMLRARAIRDGESFDAWCRCPPDTGARLCGDAAYCNACDCAVRPRTR